MSKFGVCDFFSILKVKLSKSFYSGTQQVKDKILSLKESFFKALYGQLMRKQLDFQKIQCEA
jgi:4'-phosphopantetheinyl transferase EntD